MLVVGFTIEFNMDNKILIYRYDNATADEGHDFLVTEIAIDKKFVTRYVNDRILTIGLKLSDMSPYKDFPDELNAKKIQARKAFKNNAEYQQASEIKRSKMLYNLDKGLVRLTS